MTTTPSLWLIAGTPGNQPYPCRCSEARYGRCSPKWCPCAGRTDLDDVPPECCAHHHTPAVVEAAWRAA
jgi:hypothetical protein